ncbi:MAG: SDR family oxidoreductase [Candidatus Sungbacteria bacterium]|nr:SDR family oxidoreductase [Candidatus Sungbacteria bacterium]
MKSLENKVILLTGATGGIGEATALELAKERAILILGYHRKHHTATRIAKECLRLGSPNVHLLKLDLQNPASINITLKQVIKWYGSISILINNAGINFYGSLLKRTDNEIQKILQINLWGPILLTQRYLPYVEEMVINIGSRFSKFGSANLATYCASKFGIRGFTKSLAAEYPHLDIYLVNPDATATSMTSFVGRPAKDVAHVIVSIVTRRIRVPYRSDIDIWEIVK